MVGGYALGYLHGHQDALGSVWNLRNAPSAWTPPYPPTESPP